MTTVAFDPRMGASGDMLLGALVAAGGDPAVLEPITEAIDVTFEIEELVTQGIEATDVTVTHAHGDDHHGHAEGAGPHRSLGEVLEIVGSMGVSKQVEDAAKDTFELIGEAEAAVHGRAVDEIHFHEVGADDAIADITGTHALLDSLDPTAVLTTAVATGVGEVETSHGIYPVPPPAVAEIAARSDLVLQGGPVTGELLTPTGAALLATIADTVETLPPLSIDTVGYGSGTHSFEGRPNVLRALVGASNGRLDREPIAVLETNVDDVSPEVLGHLQERLQRAGALDVAVLPMTMKKSRPGHLVRVITAPADAAHIARLLAEETGTLGVRSVPASHRWVARREVESVEVTVGDDTYAVDVKVARDRAGEVIDVSGEYDDAARVAETTDRSVREILRRVETVAWAEIGEDA